MNPSEVDSDIDAEITEIFNNGIDYLQEQSQPHRSISAPTRSPITWHKGNEIKTTYTPIPPFKSNYLNMNSVAQKLKNDDKGWGDAAKFRSKSTPNVPNMYERGEDIDMMGIKKALENRKEGWFGSRPSKGGTKSNKSKSKSKSKSSKMLPPNSLHNLGVQSKMEIIGPENTKLLSGDQLRRNFYALTKLGHWGGSSHKNKKKTGKMKKSKQIKTRKYKKGGSKNDGDIFKSLPNVPTHTPVVSKSKSRSDLPPTVFIQKEAMPILEANLKKMGINDFNLMDTAMQSMYIDQAETQLHKMKESSSKSVLHNIAIARNYTDARHMISVLNTNAIVDHPTLTSEQRKNKVSNTLNTYIDEYLNKKNNVLEMLPPAPKRPV